MIIKKYYHLQFRCLHEKESIHFIHVVIARLTAIAGSGAEYVHYGH